MKPTDDLPDGFQYVQLAAPGCPNDVAPELSAMAAIAHTLEPLDPNTRARVVRWAAAWADQTETT